MAPWAMTVRYLTDFSIWCTLIAVTVNLTHDKFPCAPCIQTFTAASLTQLVGDIVAEWKNNGHSAERIMIVIYLQPFEAWTISFSLHWLSAVSCISDHQQRWNSSDGIIRMNSQKSFFWLDASWRIVEGELWEMHLSWGQAKQAADCHK